MSGATPKEVDGMGFADPAKQQALEDLSARFNDIVQECCDANEDPTVVFVALLNTLLAHLVEAPSRERQRLSLATIDLLALANGGKVSVLHVGRATAPSGRVM
jgi:broad specificity phosphatase PhoE